MILVDTNVIIESLRGEEETVRLLEKIGLKNIAISTITEMELYIGARDKKELNFVKKRLKKIEIIDFDKKISKKSVELVFKFSKSHTLDIPDSIIAATSLINGLPLMTYNKKDFKFIPDLKLYESA
jgi:predicted nucleic acid-binding protein